MTQAAAPIAWYGGKARLASRIAALLPHHDTYVEPFGGAAAVLFAKTRATLEVYNDIDGGLVTFFRALRDRPEELARALRLTPYAREEFTDCRDTWKATRNDIERARRWYVRMRQAFGCSASVSWGYERDGSLTGGTRAGSFASTVDELERFAERFRGVQVEHLDWRKVLALYDSKHACFYVDPPYHPDTRARISRNHGYRHELTCSDHDELIAMPLLAAGSVLHSGFDHPSYRPLEQAGFERLEFSHHVTASLAPSGRRRVREVIWRRIADGHQLHPTLWDTPPVATPPAEIDQPALSLF
jgi:DNA adenine methylase